MLLGSVVRRHRSWRWKNETQPWMVFESSWRIMSWFMKGPWLPSCCTSLFRPIKLSSISPRWPTCGSSADASPRLVPPRPRWPCLDTYSATTIVSLPGELLNLGRTVIIFLAFSLEQTFWFQSFFKFFHNQRSKEFLLTHTTEDLEAYANAWANKFVDTNLRPHLAFWLLQLENAYPKELPKLKARFGKTPFTTMGSLRIMCLPHTWIETSYISWFLGLSEVFFTSHLFSLFFPFINFVSGSYCVCVILSKGRGACGEICFP